MSVYLYKGVEPYLINTKIDMLVKQSRANEFNISIYDCSEVDVALAVQDAMSLPFLCDSKVVIIKNPHFLTTEKTAINHDTGSLIRYINNPMDKTYFIINACGLKINDKLEVSQVLNKKAIVNETKEIEEVEFKGWIKRQCDIAYVSIEEDAIKSFYVVVGKDLLNAKNELDKMINYVGEDGIITKKVVDNLTSRGLQTNVFELSSAILSNNKDRIYKTYRKLIESGTDVNALIGLTVKFMKDNLLVNLMIEQSYDQAKVASRMGVSTNRAFYLLKEAKQMDVNCIKDNICRLGKLDYQIKSGQIDGKKGFELFLFSM